MRRNKTSMYELLKMTFIHTSSPANDSQVEDVSTLGALVKAMHLRARWVFQDAETIAQVPRALVEGAPLVSIALRSVLLKEVKIVPVFKEASNTTFLDFLVTSLRTFGLNLCTESVKMSLLYSMH